MTSDHCLDSSVGKAVDTDAKGRGFKPVQGQHFFRFFFSDVLFWLFFIDIWLVLLLFGCFICFRFFCDVYLKGLVSTALAYILEDI